MAKGTTWLRDDGAVFELDADDPALCLRAVVGGVEDKDPQAAFAAARAKASADQAAAQAARPPVDGAAEFAALDPALQAAIDSRIDERLGR